MPINPSPAVYRAGQVLWYLAEHPSETHTASQLARVLAIPRATCDSILQALALQGFVQRREGDTSYELGASCLALASAAQAANTVLNMTNREAEQLARDLQACVVVSAVISGQARALSVFDRGPVTMLRARVGQTIPLTPPFGVVFVAWNPTMSEQWLRLDATGGDESDLTRWHRALEFARRHGYSFSVYVAPGPQFGHVIDSLVEAPDSEPGRRARDELISELRHSEYLATQVDPEEEIHLMQISAPVFDAKGAVAASLMVVGSTRPMRGHEVEDLAQQLMRAANRATTNAKQLRLGEPAGF